MAMNHDFMNALDELRKQHGIDRETLLEAIESAVKSAYRRNFGSAGQDVEVRLDRESGSIRIGVYKDVVEEVTDETREIALEDAKAIDPGYELEDRVEFEVAPERFARIAAQTAKQVITQRVREAERERIYQDFIEKEADMITGLVQRVHQSNILIDLGKTESILEPSEQIPGERFREGDRVKLYIAEVNRTTKGPQVVLSRTHPQLIKRLLELEVPEVHDGQVEIVEIVREPGARSKVAVRSTEPNVDPVGACVGQRGNRVQNVVREIKGEKVDIVRWSPLEEEYIANALSPADVLQVVLHEETKLAQVIVPDDQLSLAIGKAGQNARLAARLTGWKVDIKGKTEAEESGIGEQGVKIRTGEGEVRVPGFFLRKDDEDDERPSRLIDRLLNDAKKDEDAREEEVREQEAREEQAREKVARDKDAGDEDAGEEDADEDPESR